MVSYYTPVAMFGRSGTGHHHHHHHTSPTQNHYFNPAAYTSGYHHPHHHQSPTGTGAPGAVVAAAAAASAATQFSPTMSASDFNSNHQYSHHFGNMSADPMAAAAAASWASQQPTAAMYSACAARNIVSTCGYENWGHGHDPHSHTAPPPPPTLPPPPPNATSQAVSFYHHHNLHHHHQHQLPSPSSSTPSPSSPSNGHQSPNNIYTTSSSFKSEFGPCSGGNSQESAAQQEMQSQGGGSATVSSAGPNNSNNSSSNNNHNNMATPHSPDSGMAISDGVSSSGSPANGGHQQHCLGGGSSGGVHHHLGSSMNPSILGSQQTNLSQQQSLHSRPTQVRSPFEWMKKPSYSISCTSNGKTRTKDKYRVVYSDTQRVELEKEFHYSRYITIRRKAELASILGLSERQVKIWFQNRRAKERKQVRKQEEMLTREKIATMVHMQSAAVAAANGGMSQLGNSVLCNQGNGNALSSLM